MNIWPSIEFFRSIGPQRYARREIAARRADG
jgi:hypothetical protein